MRIAILGDALDFQSAGIHYYTHELVNLLSNGLPDFRFTIIRAKRNGEYPDNTDEQVIPVKNWIPAHRRLRQYLDIPHYLKRAKPDVVIEPAHFGPFNLPGSIKRLTVIHDLTPLLFPSLHTFSGAIAHKFLLPGVLHKSDRLVAVSENTKLDLIQLFPELTNKISVIQPAISERFFKRIEGDTLQKYGINKPYFLFVGTLEPRKNLSLLIQAFNYLKSIAPLSPIQLVLAGKYGWKSAELLHQIQNGPFKHDIIQTGYVESDDLPVLYSQSLALVYPSKYEGFGLPVAEALACGTSVISTANGSLREFEGLPCVFLFNNDNPETLAKEMAHLLYKPNLCVGKLPAYLDRRTLVSKWRKVLLDLIQK